MDTKKAHELAGLVGILLAGCWLACSAAFAGTTLEPRGIVTSLGADAVAFSADYDGDGLSDPALYQADSAQWHAFLSSRSYTDNGVILGGPGFDPILGDFDGDGTNDPAVYSESTGAWLVALSASGYQTAGTYLGGPGYNPVASDFDGDGLADLAVYQPATGQWVIWYHVDQEETDLNVMALMYSNAMVNASNVVTSKIKRDLTAITPDNTNLIWRTNTAIVTSKNLGASFNQVQDIREVLVASYMTASIASNYHVGQYSLMKFGSSWVTAVPELKNFCRHYTGTNINLRLKQLLGLPATTPYDTVVEYYVDPQYLLRPSRDPEITDREAEISFRTNTPYAYQVNTNYSAWFQNEITGHNYGMTNGVWNAFPWSQLGYTYDWLKTGNNVAGLSEFVIPGKMLFNPPYSLSVLVYVVSITDAASYKTVPNNLVIPPQGFTINIAPQDR
ncbi:MAG: VCBS repeat-containing protein [Kiritimatiellae bacterium]|nr:VCBS repeat-containing protein [Kiritimatiellia bacterium]